jgi:zinc protease
MTATMLSEGTKTRTSQQIAEALEFLGSELEIDASREHVLIGAEALTSHWPAALEILSDVVRNPTFPERELERVRSERLADLSRIVDDPVAIAHRAARALLYGPETSYGHPAIGTENSVKAFTAEELASHYQSCYGPSNATLLVVGDVSRDDLVSQAEVHLGDWVRPSSRTADGSDGTESSPAPATIYIADKPGAPQSVIRAGHLTIDRGDPDFYGMMLISYVFGGHPTARLFMNLRQDKGYSYGYYSSIDWFNGPSAIFAGGSVETSVTKESVVETLKEFAGIRGESAVTEDEYNDARDGLFRGFPSQFETQGQLLHQLGRQVVFGLEDDYYSRLLSRLDEVTIEQIHKIAAARIDDAHLSVLVVGDKNAIEPGLRELGLPIVEVDSEGRAI